MLDLRSVTPTRRHLLAIALASFAVLFFQITITRVLSVVLWYHWVFLSISLAMLGLGAPGVWFALRPPREHWLPWLLLCGGLSVPLAVAAVLRIGNSFGPWSVVASMACMLVPFLLLGAAVCLLLLAAKGSAVGRMYAADLLGASVTAAVMVPVLHAVATPLAIAWLGLLPVLGSLLLATRWMVVAVAANVAAAVIAIAALAIDGRAFEVRITKSYDETLLTRIHERWTPTARLAFFDLQQLFGAHSVGFGWGLGS